MGALRSRGIFIQRWKLRQAIHAIDPISASLRWCPRVQ